MKVERNNFVLRGVLAVLVLAPVLGGCSGIGGLSDFNMKDQEWFARPGKIFGNRSLTLETPPLSIDKPVTPDDLISSEGACPGVAPAGPADANALQDSGQTPAAPVAPVALGHTECDVARAVGTPNSVNLSRNARGDRVATIVYLQGPRAGSYTFTAGRLTMIERVDQPASTKPAKPAKPSKKRAAT
ncbi:MAG: hypothetical protein K2X60_09430 [Xanthobacteraceae bacterium]|nr:hypothetical protein [Xanthobacteraceae bacterium]